MPLGGLGVPALISRLSAGWSVEPPNRRLMDAQTLVWDRIEDYYFRLEVTGWERLPDEPSLGGAGGVLLHARHGRLRLPLEVVQLLAGLVSRLLA